MNSNCCNPCRVCGRKVCWAGSITKMLKWMMRGSSCGYCASQSATGKAISHVKASHLLKTRGGKVCGVSLTDTESPDQPAFEVKAKVVVNACGPWSDELREEVGGEPHIRKLRGSHLIFARERWALPAAGTIVHPRDQRALFIIPWEGASMIGTTDLDHDPKLDKTHQQPFISQEEIDYLLEAVNFLFPEVKLTQSDILSTFSGIRPTISMGDVNHPSHVSRVHALYQEQGLITITGGKFTTFRIMRAKR